ncbi:MAG: IS3 family transposase [Chloroflexi bacterium]|nr:IS3 family transposase [Chloroflexota bacterium]
MTREDPLELRRLRAEHRALREELRRLRPAATTPDPAAAFAFIARERVNHPVTLLCRALGVSPSGYWAWRGRGPSPRDRADRELLARIVALYEASGGAAGAPRIRAALAARGVRCGRKRVARLMRRHGLVGSAGPKTRGTGPGEWPPFWTEQRGRQSVGWS